jgi:hypothetical protein
MLTCSVVLAFAAQAFAQCGTIPILSPVNGATNVSPNIANTVTVSWSPVAGATSYDVYFGAPGAACTAGSPRATVVANAFAPPAADITPSTSYEWKVRAIGTACNPAPETVCATFTTATAACPSGPPALNAPANNAQVPFGTVTLQWTNVANASSYEVYIGVDGGVLTSRGTTVGTQKAILLGPGHTIEWKVVALNSSCPQQASPHFMFTTTCPTGTPILQSPNNGSQFPGGTPIPFGWSAFIGASNYDLEASPAGLNQWQTLGNNIVGTTFTATLAPGNWDWRVRANFEGTCPPATSVSRSLSVTATCNNQSPELTEPDRSATVKSPVTFKWTSVNALRYRLYTQKPGETVPALLATTTRTDFSAILDPGTYSWTVIAEFANCPELPAVGRTFTVQTDPNGCPANPGTAILLAPAANATNLTSPVTFTWQKVDGAKGYRVLAAFGNASAVNLGTTTDLSLTSAVPAGSGTWLVQTLFGDNCPTTLSERRSFNVSGGAQCLDAAPVPLSPPNGATNVDSPVTFKWSAVTGAISYRLYVAPGSDDFSFYGDTTATELQRFVPTGTLHWYVLANFAACPDTRSNTASFEVTRGDCGNGTIELKTPAEGASTTSPVHLSWSGLSGSGNEYRVWVSANGSAPVTLARTTATEATLSLPSGAITWYVDAPRTGCPTAISREGHFTIAQSTNCGSNQAPSLVSPAGTEAAPAQTTSPVTLTWNAVSNALGYRVWLSETGEAFEDVALTRETHLQLALDPAKYRWYVQALFEGCDPLSSSIAFFNVARTTPRCPTGAATILTPAEGAVTTSPVTISWTAVDQARKYRLFASRNGDSAILLGTTSETSLDRDLPPGQYVISIETLFEECPSTVSERRSFSIAESQNCSKEAATLVAPPNNAADVAEPVVFVWNPVSGAVKYVLFVQANDGSPTAIDVTDRTQVTHLVPPGRIHWWVLTFFSGCEPTESEHFQFTIPRPAGCGTARPILLLPSDDARAVFSPVHFEWVPVPDTTSYNVWLVQGDELSIVATTTEPRADVVLDPGTYRWFVEATFAECSPRRSAVSEVTVRGPIPCGRPDKPQAQVVGAAQSNTIYRVRWTTLANVGLYELQESTSPEFTSGGTFSLSSTSKQFSHEVTSTPVQYLYRVRGVSNCSDDRGPYSNVVGVFVIAPKTNNASAEAGAVDDVLQTIFLPGQGSPSPQFTATADKPWITIKPSTGLLPPEGITLTISADPSVLDLGTNTATIVVNYTGSAAHGPRTNATTFTTVPVSVSLVTPITPTGSSSPPPDSLIFPVVGHATGANDSLFESDIRVTNLTAQTIKYMVKFTPSGTDGTQTGSSSNVQIEPNQTLALDDIVSSLFGTGTTSSATGTLEVRPLTTSTSSPTGSLFSSVASLLKPLNTAASSRTYNFTPTGTFGQFIPAIRFDQFVGKPASGPSPILSLQQVAQSSAYRANFGFAEGSGQAANLVVRVYDTASTLLATIPVSLQAGEHRQINGMLSANGINNLTDGRVEVEVVGGSGKVTAYVSEVDNQTNDPLLVDAALKGGVTSNRYVVPGVAYINSGFAFWVTDLRIFNPGAATPATLTFYPQGSPGAAVTREITLDAGEIEVLDNVIGGLFAQPNGAGGSIAVSTPSNTQLIATARTYNQTEQGTYGQYIPGVTPAQSVGVSDRALQILQLEQSSRFRTNIGLDETSGQSAKVEVTLIVPDSIASPVVTYDLAANEFRQFSLADFNLGSAIYNARVTVKVVGGSGRVTAYGSAIDLVTQDPTYVPAQ